MILLLLHFLPSFDQLMAARCGYWWGLSQRALTHWFLPWLWCRVKRDDWKAPFRIQKPGHTLRWSIIGSLLAATLILGAYALLRPQMDPSTLKAEISRLYPLTLGMYLAVSSAITLINPMMEEYFWRGFLFRKLQQHPGSLWTGALFSLHHWVMFREWFSDELLWIATLGLALSGILLNWLYHHTGNLWAGLCTHMAADLAIIIAGYHLLFVS
jgi:membrane protease YdiL (CAAX protease family)